MAGAELTIHRLHLGPAPPPLAARLAVQLDDALRTSTKPAALQHRHVLVRRLRLRTPGAASAQALARQLEQAWQRIAALAQPLDTAGDTDEAVWAPSEAAARVALVLRWTRGESPSAWFWQRIARPAGDAGASAWPQRALRLMLAPLAVDGPPGWVAAPPGWAMTGHAGPAAPALRPVLQAMADAGALPRFAALLTPDEAQQLAAVVAAAQPATAAWVPPPGPAAGVPQAPGPAPATGALALAWAVLQRRLAAWPPGLADVAPPPPAAGPAAPAPPPAEALPAPAPPGLAPTLPPVGGVATDTAASAAGGRHQPAPAAPHDATTTAWAGVWLLLPVLLRCGLGDDAAPLAAFAQALQAAPGALHIPADDPVRAQIAALDLPTLDGPGPGPGAWLRRARLLALRDARLPLRRIALRPGTVHLSDVRLDVVFAARAADVRIRRAGFDLDPGFVPWLGRIVHIHYV